MVLEPGEKEIFKLSGRYRGTNGSLTLTSRRVVFEQSSGLLSKRDCSLLDLPLASIQNVNIDKSLFKKLLVIITKGDHFTGIPRHEFEIQSPESIQKMILVQMSSRYEEIEDKNRQNRIQYVLDFSFLKAEMEMGGLIVQTIKCLSCYASIDLPRTGGSTKCEYCGSTVNAQDVYDKMKGLIKSL